MNVRLSCLVIGTLFVCLSSLGAEIPPDPKLTLLREEGDKPYTGKRLKPAYLRCEYRTDPLGIDVGKPRLSWEVTSGQRGQRQTAYRVLVASSPAVLKKNRGDLWDSGKVRSSETIGVVYGGRSLSSGQHGYWKVMVWDREDRRSDWSTPARWTMGLLKPLDWSAEWIGYDEARQMDLAEAPFGGARWIWHAADPKLRAPKVQRLLVSTLVLAEDQAVEKAELLVTADDAFRFVINTVLVSQNGPGGFKEPQLADVTRHLKVGTNQIRVEVGNSSEGPAGLLAKLTVTTRDGRTIVHATDRSWKTWDTPGANWHNRDLDTASWPAAAELGDYGVAPWGPLKFARLFLPPVPFLRTTFRADKPIARATLYATALGNVDLHLNGRRVSDEFFTPGWTDYTRRVYYRTWEVTQLMRRGPNAMGALLSDGWYSGYLGFGKKRDHYGKKPRLRAQLVLEFKDGSRRVLGTGPHWKATTGPVREADFLMGERYDARLELAGWDRPEYDDQEWQPVVVGCDEVQPILQAHPGPPVLAFAELTPLEITEPQPGTFVLNLGQNFAGVYRLKVSGKSGQVLTLRFAERLNPDGTIYTTNLREARVTDTYICRGGRTETWEPRFTFHGYQYVEITGLEQPPSLDTFTGIALSSDTPVVGSFTSSDPLLNKLYSNIYWTQRANFIDLPTDCPQRDERLGWTGDAQVYIRAATLNTDVHAFFTKWLVDLEDGQRPDGQFPMVAPVKVAGDDGGPAWADAGVICPWTTYQVYGDTRLLAKHYPAMQRFIDFCEKRSTPDRLPPESFHCFGDWLSIQADTPKGVIYTAYFAYSTWLTARAAETLGKTEETARYDKLFTQIKEAFNRAYLASDGRIQGDTQTAYVLALAFNLLDDEKAQQAAQHLIDNIQSRDWHLSTGFIGTKDLMLVLAKIGRNDVAYRLIHNDTFPSWGFSIRHGGTSIWEHWDGWTPEHGFKDPAMNSFAHYSFGAVYQWMVENIGGIRIAAPGYSRILIEPYPDGNLSAAEVHYRSVRGRISTAWKKRDGVLTLDLTIPANTTATVRLPARSEADVAESGRTPAKAEGVAWIGMEDGRAVLEVHSGQYRFTTVLP